MGAPSSPLLLPPPPPPPAAAPPPPPAPSPVALLIPAGQALRSDVASALATFVSLASASAPPPLFALLRPVLLQLNAGSLRSSGAWWRCFLAH